MDSELPCTLSCHGKVMLVVVPQPRPAPHVAEAWTFCSRSKPHMGSAGLLFRRVRYALNQGQSQQGRRHSRFFRGPAQLTPHKPSHVQSHIRIGHSRAARLPVLFQNGKIPLHQHKIPVMFRIIGMFRWRSPRRECVTDELRHDHSSLNGSLLPCKGMACPPPFLYTVSPSPLVTKFYRNKSKYH